MSLHPPPDSYPLKVYREAYYKQNINESTIQLNEINIFQSSTYKKDLDWLHLDDDASVQQKQ